MFFLGGALGGVFSYLVWGIFLAAILLAVGGTLPAV